MVFRRFLLFIELPSVLLHGHILGVGPQGHEKGPDFPLLHVEDNKVSPQFRDHCVGSLVGMSNSVHTFRDNVLFVDVSPFLLLTLPVGGF